MTEFRTTRIIDGSVEDVFSALSNARRLERWWGPAGFSNKFLVCEFRPGGRWSFVMVGPDGKEFPNENIFAEVEPPHRVVVEHPGDPVFRLEVSLAPSAGGTLITWRQMFDSDEVAQRMKPIVTVANEQNLDRWEAEVRSSKGPSLPGISSLGQVMLYVKDQDACAQFWTQTVGFVEVGRFDSGTGFRWIEVSPASRPGTSLVLHSKEAVAKMAPELNLGAPSLMFFTASVDQLRQTLEAKGVTVGPLVARPDGRVFNFSDPEGNYFAVLERA